MADLRASELRERVRQLARLLEFPTDTFTGREREAALIMAALALMPTVRDRDKRRAYGNEIMANADHLLPSEDPDNAGFWNKLRELLITMQELPAWYLHFSKSNEELIRDHWWLNLELTIMKVFGLGGLAFPFSGPGKNAIQALQSNFRSGPRAVATAIAKGSVDGAARTATAGMTGRLLPVWVLGSLTYLGGMKNLAALRGELVRRYQEQRMPEEQLQRALGNAEPLPRTYLYELRR